MTAQGLEFILYMMIAVPVFGAAAYGLLAILRWAEGKMRNDRY